VVNAPVRSWEHAASGDTYIPIIQGEFHVTRRKESVLTTTLGSCVATCLRDPVARVGGMNHFLLPHGANFEGPDARRYGAHAMELLTNGLLHAGARRERIEAKVFGGGRLNALLPDIGAENVAFAMHYVIHEGMTFKGASVGGRHGRRIQFWPVSGRVRQLALAGGEVLDAEHVKPIAASDAGEVEFFNTGA